MPAATNYKSSISSKLSPIKKSINLNGKDYTPLLFVLLLIASFFLGSLTTKVQYLQNGTSPSSLNAGNSLIPQAPSGEEVAEKPTGDIAPVSDEDHIRGNKNAKVKLVEYSDLECPFCKQFHPTLQEIMQTYGDDVAWVYRHYPLTSIHPNAQKAAEGSECAAELGGENAFWAFVDVLFEDQTRLADLESVAAETGVNQQAFTTCLNSGKYTQKVNDQLNDGTAGGVSGTPSTFIVSDGQDPQLIVGAQPIESVKTVIDQALSN